MPVPRHRLATAGVKPATSNASRTARRTRLAWVEAALAVAAFAALCAVVLAVAPRPEEPDDGAYRASIVAMTDYTDVVVLGCAVATVIVAWRLRAAALPLQTLCVWLASVAVFLRRGGHLR